MKAAPTSAFRLSWPDASAENFAHVLRVISSRARDLAGDLHEPASEALHELRLLVKRTRALLWFARPVMAGALHSHLKLKLRQAAQLLAGQRDRRAAEVTLEKVSSKAGGARERAAIGRARAALSPKATGSAVHQRSASFDHSAKILCTAVEAFARAVERSSEWPSSRKRTTKAFRAMGKAGRKARRSLENADFHNWRKKTKRLLYLLELRASGSSKRETRLRKRLDELQEVLGEDHDCVVAAEQIGAAQVRRAFARPVAKLLARRQQRLRGRLKKLARRLGGTL